MDENKLNNGMVANETSVPSPEPKKMDSTVKAGVLGLAGAIGAAVVTAAVSVTALIINLRDPKTAKERNLRKLLEDYKSAKTDKKKARIKKKIYLDYGITVTDEEENK